MIAPNNHPWRILLVDDEPSILDFLTELMREAEFEPIQARNGAEALAVLRQGIPDLVLLDLYLPGMNGMKVLKEARKIDRLTPIIMLSGQGSIALAVEAMKEGAHDFLTKPLDAGALILKVRRGIECRRIKQENQRLRAQVDADVSLLEMMGSSDPIRTVFAAVQRVAPTEFTVIVSGETGAGKDLVARAIHRQSPRESAPFVPVDCGAIQPNLIESELFGHEKGAFTGADRTHAGKFETAKGGTLFLDEVQNLPLPVQTKFLRALQQRQICHVGGTRSIDIDIRVIAATNQDLATLVADGRFRQDLYHRLNEFCIPVPPLRERRDDIIYLAKRFLDMTREELRKDVAGIAGPALEVLLEYPWPGNVRELRNIIRRAVLVADSFIELEHLCLKPARACHAKCAVDAGMFDVPCSFKELVRSSVCQVEREILIKVLKQTGGNKAKAARLLQIDYKTIHTKTKEYGICLLKGDNHHVQEEHA